MISAFGLYGKLLRPWLTVVVYLWILELIASFSLSDPEPLIDRLADCSAILATLVFWTGIVSLLPWLGALIFQRESILALNARANKGALVLITALALVRWLFLWTALLGDPNAVAFALMAVGLFLGAWLWRRRKRTGAAEPVAFSLADGWSYCAAPILITCAAILAIKIGANIRLRESNRAALNRASEHRPNVVIFVADALRAQNMSLYGYGRKTTPFLERFADQSMVFTEMHSNSTSTRTSLTTILSGKNPLTHGRLTKFLPEYESAENLVALLRDQGYTTAAVTSNADATFYYLGLVKYLVRGEYPNFLRLTLSFLRDNGIYPTNPGTRMYNQLAQFFPYLGYPEKTLGYGPAGDTMKLATGMIAVLPEPYFLFIHVHEPHNPYETPAPFKGKYAKLDHRQVNNKIVSDFYGRYKPELQPYVDAHRDHYDEAIEYLDTELEKFVSGLERGSQTRNLLLVLTADHGESFERGFLNHGEDLYESSVRVPLIMKLPHDRKGERMVSPAQSSDIAPTILDTIGLAVPNWMDGLVLTKQAGVEAKETVIVNYKDPVEGRIFKHPTKLAILRWQFKMIVSCDTGRAELYDLSRDPGEQSDLSSSHPLIVKELSGKLAAHLAKQKSTAPMECPVNLMHNVQTGSIAGDER